MASEKAVRQPWTQWQTSGRIDVIRTMTDWLLLVVLLLTVDEYCYCDSDYYWLTNDDPMRIVLLLVTQTKWPIILIDRYYYCLIIIIGVDSIIDIVLWTAQWPDSIDLVTNCVTLVTKIYYYWLVLVLVLLWQYSNC